MPSGNKPLPESMLTQICVTIWHHQVIMSLRDAHLCISNLQVGLDCFQNSQPRCVLFIFWSRCEQVEQNGKEILAKLCKLSTILIWRENKMPQYIITRAMKHTEVRTKRPTYCRQHFQMYFAEWQSILIKYILSPRVQLTIRYSFG